MKSKLLTVALLTLLVLIGLTLIINKFSLCYSGFTIDLKTPGDGCDFSYFLLRIGYLPHVLVVLSAIFLSLRILKKKVK